MYDKEIAFRSGRGGKKSRNEQVSKLKRLSVDIDAPKFIPIKPRYGDWPDDNYHVLTRPILIFLESRIGEPWDDVYSEICRRNPKTERNYRFHQWLKGSIYLNTYEKDGKVYDNISARWNNSEIYSSKRYKTCYVDSEGILRAAPLREPKNKEIRITCYEKDSRTFAVQNRKGIWFEFIYSNEYNEITTEKEVSIPIYGDAIQSTMSYYHRYYYSKPIINYIKKTISVKSYKQTYSKVWVDSESFEYLPYKNDFYSSAQQPVYLISVKTMSRKEKKKWGII